VITCARAPIFSPATKRHAPRATRSSCSGAGETPSRSAAEELERAIRELGAAALEREIAELARAVAELAAALERAERWIRYRRG
jgi:hypothetical protein